MHYATREDLLTADASFVWNVAMDPETQQLDEARIVQALDDTDEEINSWLSRRYKLPLETAVPRLLQRVAVSIAFYWLADSDNQVTELVQKRYDEAVNTLKGVANGQRDLGLPTADQPTEGTGGKVIMVGENPRLMTRNSLKGVL
ncbi:gp436 family protein [Serratia ficaria]|uniref:gp436 family protein n=1 Tax=Serratia ficaria TaxID=61651 RepID=UPI00217907E3|nr:DUF1320 domain-containing protein [Serratia ficaria]CAI0789727.1 Mu-like prophage protein gp36 [Serratia ficaria]CAI1253384.1 Mu-like prophage protein gp36 [Serratia ficaria]CAI2023472.1 Mu-like prophage protein gp36 [Serratia ficaria]CAI2407514.1 Mu-like prophage protein gp36 [Serratia ficaria]CAI2439291.1 Mu-like prophage protein gp36 [Serratia ficaria]